MNLTLQEIARRLGGEVRGNQVLAPGPGHSPKDRSLAAMPSSTAPEGFVVYSHAGDDPIVCKDFVRDKLGLAPFDAGVPTAAANLGERGDAGIKAKARIKAAYDYHNEQGELLFQVLRLEPKGFRQRRPDGNGGWHWSLGDTRRVLYRLPEIIEAVASNHPTFIAEGEQAVDALVRLGVPATCAPGGAGKWRMSYSGHLKGADVVILPDNDEAGEQHAKSVEASLAGVAARVRVLRLPELPDRGDPFDWIESGGTVAQLWQLVETDAVADGGDGAADIGVNEPKQANGPDAITLPPLTLAEWLDRDLPEPDRVLGDLLSTTSRVLIVGPTGLGKTMFGIAVAMAMAEGQAFLHWKAGRKCRVLYVDGEISRREMKRRLRDAAWRVGAKPDGLCILSTEDYPDMPPLNTPKGQKWFNAFIEKHGPFDLIIFDNVQALLVGNMKEEEQWASILPWARSLTRRSIGQIWFHHTGHDESKSYGSKAREWQMDTVILMERVEIPGSDLSFSLKFTKARERTPDNRDDFEPMTMSLKDGKWTYERTDKASHRPMSDRQQLAYEALVSLAAKHGEPLPASYELPPNILAMSVAALKDEILARGIVSADASNPRARLDEIITGLKRHHVAAERDGRIWPITEHHAAR